LLMTPALASRKNNKELLTRTARWFSRASFFKITPMLTINACPVERGDKKDSCEYCGFS
jgi:hypothetical protein